MERMLCSAHKLPEYKRSRERCKCNNVMDGIRNAQAAQVCAALCNKQQLADVHGMGLKGLRALANKLT